MHRDHKSSFSHVCTNTLAQTDSHATIGRFVTELYNPPNLRNISIKSTPIGFGCEGDAVSWSTKARQLLLKEFAANGCTVEIQLQDGEE